MKQPSPEANLPRLLDLKQAAKYSGIPYWTIYSLATGGIIPVVQLPDSRHPGKLQRRIWIRPEALDDYIRGLEAPYVKAEKPNSKLRVTK